jgi:Zn-dependent protease
MVLGSALQILLIVIKFAITINITLGLFNLIPLPPLDGSKIIKIILPKKAKMWYINNEQILYVVFMILWLILIYV